VPHKCQRPGFLPASALLSCKTYEAVAYGVTVIVAVEATEAVTIPKSGSEEVAAKEALNANDAVGIEVLPVTNPPVTNK
jgi:methenyltetrahydromethanopterin cyclohydrolase